MWLRLARSRPTKKPTTIRTVLPRCRPTVQAYQTKGANSPTSAKFVTHFGIRRSACTVEKGRGNPRGDPLTFRPAAVALALLVLPAFAKSEKSRVVQKALRHSVRVEVLVRGKVERAASGVVVATEGETSYVLTNEQVDVGDDVVVVGAPCGRALSVSSGIVSQL